MQPGYQRSAIQSTLGGDNLNRRVAWMNRVLGSLYVDDDMVQDDDGGRAAAWGRGRLHGAVAGCMGQGRDELHGTGVEGRGFKGRGSECLRR